MDGGTFCHTVESWAEARAGQHRRTAAVLMVAGHGGRSSRRLELGRDAGAIFDSPGEHVFMIKVDHWIDL